MKNKGNKFWIVLCVIIGIFILIGSTENYDDSQSTETLLTDTAGSDYSSNDITDSNYDDSSDEDLLDDDTDYSTDSGSNLTLGQQNAADKAIDYINYTAFSYNGLVEQLEFDGFSHDEAVYGTDNCGADWNEQAAIKAQDYLDYSSFSRSELIDQLEFDGFTSEQAEYGVKAVGY